MTCAPGFLASLGHTESLGQIIQFLEYELNLHLAAEMPRSENLAEGLLERMSDDKHHFPESGTDGIVNRIVDNRLTVGAYSVHLLQGTIAGTHARCQYY